MLFMSVYTFEPENRDAVQKRRAEKGAMVPPGARLVGEWSSLAGHRVFRLIETEDPKAFLAGVMAWSDLGKSDVYPVMAVDDVIKLIAARQ
jgi:hypothetical protein